MLTTQFANINLLWGELLIEELSRHGVSDICIAPGSRSTPLTLAVAHNNEVIHHCHFDERGLGFFALGLAKATRKPVAIITTSGSAVANLYPALIEARLSRVPLIILSADRPDELIGCGANQAINQRGIFADTPVFHLALPTASLETPAAFVLTSLDHALAVQRNQPGPVHINCMFREPLYAQGKILEMPHDFSGYLDPLSAWICGEKVYSQYHGEKEGLAVTGPTNLDAAQSFVEQLTNKKILVICGQFDPMGADAKTGEAILNWAALRQLPVLADCQSSLQRTPSTIVYYDQLLHKESFQQLLDQTEVILQFGARTISNRLGRWLQQSKADLWLVFEGFDRLDPNHRVNQRFVLSATCWLAQIGEHLEYYPENESWLAMLQAQDQSIASWLNQFDLSHPALSEYGVMRCLNALLPSPSNLFLGNSLPVRLYDMFSEPGEKNIVVYCNRGTSGIDGIVATAAGVATGSPAIPTTLVIGDTSLLHDLNSLAFLAQSSRRTASFTIIVLNNDGGAIFNLLPVSTENNIRRDFYQMPHGYSFIDACQMFKLQYYQPQTLAEFKNIYLRSAVTSSTGESGPDSDYSQQSVTLIEIKVPPTETTDLIQTISEQLCDISSL